MEAEEILGAEAEVISGAGVEGILGAGVEGISGAGEEVTLGVEAGVEGTSRGEAEVIPEEEEPAGKGSLEEVKEGTSRGRATTNRHSNRTKVSRPTIFLSKFLFKVILFPNR